MALSLAAATHAQVPGTRAAAGPPAPPAMSVVPEGDFWMGRTRFWLIDEIGWQIRERADDRPVHRVALGRFFMDSHEVTNDEYASFAASAGVTPPYHWGGPRPPAGKERLPVYNVNWLDAVRYCTAQGKRLPTEAEWEKAARGGLADMDFPWGNDFGDEPGGAGSKAATRSQAGSSTGPVAVGSFAPNGYGLSDMSGNVWEWVSDWYDVFYYSTSGVENPQGPAEGRYKVIRGGSWADTESRLGAVYFRNFTAPATAQPTIGFRCARSIGAPASAR